MAENLKSSIRLTKIYIIEAYSKNNYYSCFLGEIGEPLSEKLWVPCNPSDLSKNTYGAPETAAATAATFSRPRSRYLPIHHDVIIWLADRLEYQQL